MGPSFSLWLNDRPGGARAAQALLHMAVSYSPREGGEADVEKGSYPGAAGFVLRRAGDVLTHHKSVLAVRLDPERLAV